MRNRFAGQWRRFRGLFAGRLGSIQGIAAVVLICVGVGFWSIPAALVVAGVLILADKVT